MTRKAPLGSSERERAGQVRQGAVIDRLLRNAGVRPGASVTLSSAI